MTQIPGDIATASDYERHARQAMDKALLAFLAGGAGSEATVRANRDAFERIGIYNRVLSDVSSGHTTLDLLGKSYRHPIFLAPLAFQQLYHDKGETALAQAAEATDSCLILSTLSSVSLEDVAPLAGPCWFQLYFQARRDDTLSLLRRAERTGYEAIVVTLDTPVIPFPAAALRAGFRMPPHVRAVNTDGFTANDPAPPEETQSVVFQGPMAQAPGWDDLDWLLKETSLPVLIKGVSHPDDARRCVDAGAAGVIVSTHGGRTLDGLPAALDLLPAVRAALGPACPVLVDSGIRSGSDIFKALATGADGVLIGRLQAYALSVGGALGVAHMIKLLREELELTMALAGCACLDDIGPDCLTPPR